MRRTFPRLTVVLSLFVFSWSAQAQLGVLPEGRATAPAAVTVSSATVGSSEPASLPDLVRRVKPSVVSVLTYDSKGEPLISGSGFFIRPGEVVTNVHVLRNAQRVEIRTLEGKPKNRPLSVRA